MLAKQNAFEMQCAQIAILLSLIANASLRSSHSCLTAHLLYLVWLQGKGVGGSIAEAINGSKIAGSKTPTYKQASNGVGGGGCVQPKTKTVEAFQSSDKRED